jgi:hypothetical protein
MTSSRAPRPTCGCVDPVRRGIVVVGQHPHAATAQFLRDPPQLRDERPPDPAPAISLVDRQLVEKQLGNGLVRMRQDGSGDEARGAPVDIREQQHVRLVGEKAPRRSHVDGIVEERLGRLHLLLAAGRRPPEVHAALRTASTSSP